MKNCIQSSEEKIKEAAKFIFLKKGFAGTTARDIAEAAGMNIALTNYYFRSKEKLFHEVFRELFTLYCETTLGILEQPITFQEKLIRMIDEDFRLMKHEPKLVLFIMNEMHRNPEPLIPELFKLKNVLRTKLYQQFEEEISKGTIRPDVAPENLVPMILGGLQFIFICRNMQMKMNDMNEEQFDVFAENHKYHLSRMITNYLFNHKEISTS
ncbi:MAG: TetR/AcrR family transcriptional regulator [Siphonobacter sp.]